MSVAPAGVALTGNTPGPESKYRLAPNRNNQWPSRLQILSPAFEADNDARHCDDGRDHGSHRQGHRHGKPHRGEHRRGERAYERGFDAGFTRGRESAAS